MVTTLTGDNSFLLRQELASRRADFIDRAGSAGVEQLEASAQSADQLRQALTGSSLLASQRLVVVKNLSLARELHQELAEWLGRVPAATEVIIVEPVLDKRSQLYKLLRDQTNLIVCQPLEGTALTKWLGEYVAQQGGRITAADIHRLIGYVGTDQAALAQELDKLLAYQATITQEAIEQLVEPRPQETVFQLLELIIGGKTTAALGLLDRLEAAFTDPFQVVNLLIWQTQVLALTVSAGKRTDREITTQTKLNPYVVTKTRRLSGRVSQSRLRQMVDAVAELDEQLKTTAIPPWRQLAYTIAKLS